MAHTTLIWDHHHLALWGSGRKGCVVPLAEGEASTVEAVVGFLESHANSLSISRLRIYIDLPALDHHLERIPQIAPKLQSQLLEQRKKKLYGKEPRAWSASPMHLNEQGSHNFYFVSSLPEEIANALVRWALPAGIYFEGIYSLPFALSRLPAGDQNEAEAQIHYTALGAAGYLIARSTAGSLLFFSRLNVSAPNAAQLEQSARRLALFTEQEFGLTPQLATHEVGEAQQETSIVAKLCNLKLLPILNLVPKSDRARQLRLRLRHRAFVLGVMVVSAAVLLVLPLVEEQQNREVDVSALNADIQSQSLSINQAQRIIEQNKAYRNVIEFSRDREALEKDDPVPVPVLIIMKSLAQALPEMVELDSYSCEIDPSGPVALIEMNGRPLSPDADLVEIMDAFRAAMKIQGWQVNEFESIFKSVEGRASRFVQRGGLRSFTVSFKINANVQKRSL
jgi:hypothetical protein